MWTQYLFLILRDLLKILTGILVAKGVIDDSFPEIVGGTAAGLAAHGFSLKRLKERVVLEEENVELARLARRPPPETPHR